MARDFADGVFIVPQKRQLGLGDKAFLKISEIAVISTPIMRDRRFLAYSVKGWSELPTEDSDPSKGILIDDRSVFYTEMGFSIASVYELEGLCKSHFNTQILKGNISYIPEQRMHDATSSPVRGMGFDLFVENNHSPVLRLKRIWHKELYSCPSDVESCELESAQSMAIMAIDDSVVSHDVVFDLDNNWFKQHCQALVEPEQFTRQRFYKIA